MQTKKESLTNAQRIDLMKKAGAMAGETVRAQVSVRAAIRRVFGETKPSKEDYDAMKDWFVKEYTPKALAAHKNDDGSYRDAYAGLTEEERDKLARKAGASYYNDRVREIYGATQRAPRAGGSQGGDDEMTPRDAALVVKAFVDAMVTKKGKDAAEAADDAADLLAMARQVASLGAMARRADTAAAMVAAMQATVKSAEAARAEAARAEAARQAEIEAIVAARLAERLAEVTGGGTVGAAVAKAAIGGRRRKAG